MRESSKPSLKYVLRMVRVLAQQHQIGVTDLALLSRVNHQRCMTNLSWMEELGLVQITPKNNRKEVIVTDTGKDYIEKWASLPLPPDLSRKIEVLYNF